MNDPAPCPRCGSPIPPDAPHGLCPRCAFEAGLDTRPPSDPLPRDRTETPALPTPAELAVHFPQLEILELLGRGGMGWVYKARQQQLDRLVALKLLPPGIAGDRAFAERFLREARALARLNHPNIVTIYDLGQAGPYFYFVMEFVDGANLRQLERSRRLSPEEAFGIVPKICEALQYAHDEGIVHRDIKPENILLDPKGRVKIADFGIAKLVGRSPDVSLTGTQHRLGTPHYMAPEQLETPDAVDHRADIYALGVVFYEMLTGELPLGRFEPPSKKLQVDVRVDEVVLKSLERSPERRYQTVGAVKTDVEAISDPAGTPPPPQGNQGSGARTILSAGTSPHPPTLSKLSGAPANPLTAQGIRNLGGQILEGMVWMLVPLAFLVTARHLDFATPLRGQVFDIEKMLLVAVCIGCLVWYSRRQPGGASASPETQPDRNAPDLPLPRTAREQGPLRRLGRAWCAWWSARPKWFSVAVQVVLVAVHLVCLSTFFSTSIKSRWESSGHRQFTYAVGAWDPWFSYETYPTPGTPFRFGMHLMDSSMLLLVAGFALYCIVWLIEKARTPKPGFWSTPAAMALLWGIWAACAIGMGMTLGQRALKDDSRGGPFAPQLQSALEIMGTDDRDRALRLVALQAAGAKDTITVLHALEEIRGSEVHDQAAAESASALATMTNGVGAAREIAATIRTDSLRDATLARIASTLPSQQ